MQQFDAPAHWRAVDMLSDLHLSPTLPVTVKTFLDHLCRTEADAVFILGDLFEVWIGDDQRQQPFEAAVLDGIARAADGRWIGFMVGNRDFLFGSAALAQARMQSLGDPTVLQIFGQRVVLSHGDALCLEDVDYQAFRRLVRSASWQEEFLRRDYDDRFSLAARIRAESRSRKARAEDPAVWADADPEMVLSWLHQAQATSLVHGHTHRPADHPLAGGPIRHVLSDWDLDGDVARAQVLRLDPSGIRRIPLAASAMA